MEAALAELTLDDAKDGEEDKDFYLDKGAHDTIHVIHVLKYFFKTRRIYLNPTLRAQMKKRRTLKARRAKGPLEKRTDRHAR